MGTSPSFRKRLNQQHAAVFGAERYVDMGLQLRRLTVDLPQEVPAGTSLLIGNVEMVTAGAGQTEVPVVSTERGASTALRPGDSVQGGGELRVEVVLSAGGRWDRLQERYDGPARAPVIVDLIEAQVEPARWVARWITRYKERQGSRRRRQKDKRTLLNYGNRASGKTVLGLLLTAAVCLEVPGTVAWVISRSRTQSQDEIHDALKELLPERWYSYHGQPAYRFSLVNGSRIREMTADAPEDLKQGRVDWAFLNEGAKMPKLAYAYPIGRISDRGGLCYIASNPPTADVPRGIWVWHLYRKVVERQGCSEWCPIEAMQSSAQDNALIDQAAREDVADILQMLDPRLAAADAKGVMQGVSPQIIHAFDLPRHGRRHAPDVGDITAEVLRRHHRVRQGFSYLAGVDFQSSFPFITCTFFKLYGKIEAPILWAVSGANPEGNEDDFLDSVLIEGIVTGEGESDEINPQTVLWIGDSSAQWQNSRHEHKAPPSFPPFLNRGFKILSPTVPVTPGALYGRNPPVGTSLGQVNRWFREDRIMVSPLAEGLLSDCRDGTSRETDKGPRPEKKHSHFLDTLRYVLWFLEPPTRRVKSPQEQRRGPGITLLPAR